MYIDNLYGNCGFKYDITTQLACAYPGPISPLQPILNDLCTNGTAHYYHIDSSDADVFVTGGCSGDLATCDDAGAPYCCADGSRPSGAPVDCSGDSAAACFDCSGLCPSTDG